MNINHPIKAYVLRSVQSYNGPIEEKKTEDAEISLFATSGHRARASNPFNMVGGSRINPQDKHALMMHHVIPVQDIQKIFKDVFNSGLVKPEKKLELKNNLLKFVRNNQVLYKESIIEDLKNPKIYKKAFESICGYFHANLVIGPTNDYIWKEQQYGNNFDETAHTLLSYDEQKEKLNKLHDLLKESNNSLLFSVDKTDKMCDLLIELSATDSLPNLIFGEDQRTKWLSNKFIIGNSWSYYDRDGINAEQPKETQPDFTNIIKSLELLYKEKIIGCAKSGREKNYIGTLFNELNDQKKPGKASIIIKIIDKCKNGADESTRNSLKVMNEEVVRLITPQKQGLVQEESSDDGLGIDF